MNFERNKREGKKFRKILEWEDSNLRIAESKSAALPLGDTPF